MAGIINEEYPKYLRNIIYMLIFIFLSSFLFLASCSTYTLSTINELSVSNTKSTENIVKLPSEPSYIIMGQGMRTKEELASFLHQNNPELPYEYTLKLAEIYINEAQNEGVNHDVAFSQMCLETGYLKYTGIVSPKQYNFSGLGAIDLNHPGEKFQTIELGVRAHIQHLKAYGSTEELNSEVIDARFKYVQRGIAPTIFDLTGKWAADPEYGEKIKNLLCRLYKYPVEEKEKK